MLASFGISLFSFIYNATAEEKTLENPSAVEESNLFQVLHHSSELYATKSTVLRYASGAKELPQSQFQNVTIENWTKQPLQLLGSGDIQHCSGAPMITVQIKRLTQKIDHALAYFRLNEASQLVDSAKAGLLCLQDVLDPDVVARLYFLDGLIQYYNGNTEATTIAYRNAIRFQPNMKWDSIYPPDSKELFDAAHEHFNSLKEITLHVYPKSAQKDVWINGIPVNPEGSISIPYGANFVQIVSVDIESAYLMVDDLQSTATLVVPSAINNQLISWVDDPLRVSELNAIVDTFHPNENILLYRNGEIWQKEDDSWLEIPVPIFAKAFGLNTKKKVGKVLYYSGLTLSGGAFLYTLDQGNRVLNAKSAANNEELTTSWDSYVNYENVFNQSSKNYYTGWTFTATGMALTGLGYWMLH